MLRKPFNAALVAGSGLAVLTCVVGCAAPGPAAVTEPGVARSRLGMVASDSPYASEAGAEILRQDGNAVDAAVATSFALGVTRPYSTGLGGGGFMVLRISKTGVIRALDFREVAPAAATPDMFAAAPRPGEPSRSLVGGLAAGVPGLLMGQINLLRRWGVRPRSGQWTEDTFRAHLALVMGPAIRLAEEGFPVDQHYVDACRSVLKTYEKFPQLKQQAPYVWNTHLRGGDLPEVGAILEQPALARTLRLIAENGSTAFYDGPIADAIVNTVQDAGGIMTRDDLRDYAPMRRNPLVFGYRDCQLISFPPPSSGGIALAEAMNILETVDLPTLHRDDPGLAAHWTVEALKHAFADRARWLGDQDFIKMPLRQLASKEYGRQLARHVRPDAVAAVDAYGGRAAAPATRPAASPPDDAGTSHFCVVDRRGNCVVWTETINTTFGSLIAVDEYGIILNNEMDDFAANPGQPNAFGLIQSENNAVAPKKKPLSSMSPTIVLRGGVPILLVGGSGGPRIISSVLQTILNVVDYDMPVDQAVRATRFHHQWRPEQVFFDREPDPAISEGLTSRGHQISPQRRGAVIQAIGIRPDLFTGASDPRKGGQPAAP